MKSGLAHRYVRPGKAGPLRKIVRLALRAWYQRRTHCAKPYASPTSDELAEIEEGLSALGIPCESLHLDPLEFAKFMLRFPFPTDYHGGSDSGVYDEKLLEHFVACTLLTLDRLDIGPYVDIAACTSPWANLLRANGLEAYAIDLEIDDSFVEHPYYRREDATCTSFSDNSIARASLQ